MLFDSPSLWTWALVAAAVAVIALDSRARRRRVHLPPGPTPLPLIGNALDVPRGHLGEGFQELIHRYGELVYLNTMGQSILVLGSYKAARELLEKRSSNYSDRPKSIMAKLTGLDCIFVLKSYGNQWRLHRRVFHQSFNSEAVENYQPIQLAYARRLLSALLKSPNDFSAQVKFSFASTLMRVAYGIELTEGNDEYFNTIERIGSVGETIAVPGRFPVEAIPSLLYLPSWFPGGGFKKYASHANSFVHNALDKLYKGAMDGLHTGVGKDSFVSRLLEDAASYDLEGGGEHDVETFIKHLAITIYNAGSDTTYNSLQAFFLAMAMHPEAQRKAQEELDRVIGTNRLPEFDDRASLPYLNALLKEVMRWHTITPIAVPHSTVADDEYNGYYIPAGTTVIANVWHLTHDPDVFPEPEAFKPERFLGANGELDLSKGDPSDFVFGFGRRICPGRYFAEASLFILAASLLHVFQILPPVDERGVPKKLEHKEASHGALSHPEVYNYVVKPRSERAARLIVEPVM